MNRKNCVCYRITLIAIIGNSPQKGRIITAYSIALSRIFITRLNQGSTPRTVRRNAACIDQSQTLCRIARIGKAIKGCVHQIIGAEVGNRIDASRILTHARPTRWPGFGNGSPVRIWHRQAPVCLPVWTSQLSFTIRAIACKKRVRNRQV